MLEKAGVFMLLFEDIKIPSGWVQNAPEVVGPGQAETCLFPVSTATGREADRTPR